MNDHRIRLGWTRHYTQVCFDPEEPYAFLSLTPVFSGCAIDLAKKGIVWDLQELIGSVSRPGGYDVVNCECGYPPDAYLHEPVAVSHPDNLSVVWEMDCKGLEPALDPSLQAQACYRLVFDRADYEASVRAMVRDVQEAARTPLNIDMLRGLGFFDAVTTEYPGRTELPVGAFEPPFKNTNDIDEITSVDADADWPREPLFPPGTLVEVGVFGSELLRVDGERWPPWVGRLFTRWETAAAFRAWTLTVSRRWFARHSSRTQAMDRQDSGSHETDPNAFVLADGHDMESAHAHGERFAHALAQAFAEGATAPGVRVAYVRSNIPEC